MGPGRRAREGTKTLPDQPQPQRVPLRPLREKGVSCPLHPRVLAPVLQARVRKPPPLTPTKAPVPTRDSRTLPSVPVRQVHEQNPLPPRSLQEFPSDGLPRLLPGPCCAPG